MSKSTCYYNFSENLLRLYFRILIDLSTESKSNSVIKFIAECQGKLLVLKHMEDPVQFVVYKISSFHFEMFVITLKTGYNSKIVT